MEWNVLYVIPLLLGLYLLLRLIYNPLGFLARLLVYLVTGAVLVVVLNLILGYAGMHVAFNLFTVLVAGILQLPGLILLVILTQWLV